jgi:hypothetical protein
MSKPKVQMNFKFQSSNKKYFDIYLFGIELAFELCHLAFDSDSELLRIPSPQG